MRKSKALYPIPVYEAHFADGTVRRMSFYQEAGKPWDFERGAQVCASVGRGIAVQTKREIIDHPEQENWRGKTEYAWSEILTRFVAVQDGPEHAEIVDGYIWHNDKVTDAPLAIVRDPRFADSGPAFYSCAVDGMPQKSRSDRVTAKQLRDLLARVLDGDEAAINEARKLAA